MSKKFKFIVLIVAMLALLAGCGKTQATQDSISANTVRGRTVFVHDSNIAFFGYDNLLCSAKYQGGSLSEFTIEAGFTGDVYALAIYGNDLYVSASDGIFKYNLDMFSKKDSNIKPVVLTENHLSEYNHFEILDNNLYYLYGTTLCCIPCEGGDIKELATEVGDFEVTENGIYYTKKDGSLRLLSLDFNNDNNVAGVAPACVITEANGNIYYEDEGIKAYSVSKNIVEDVKTEGKPKDLMKCVWVSGDRFFYKGVDSKLRLVTGGKETELGFHELFPYNKINGFVYKDTLLGYSDKTIEIYSFTDGEKREYNLDTELASQLSQLNEKSTAQTEPEPQQTQPTSKSYDIFDNLWVNKSDDIAYIYGNDFLLIMPIGYEDWEYLQTSADSFSIVYIPGKNAGYGGNLVTIKAYDPDDTSYTNLPSYHIAGRGMNTNKVFVAIYPTDVQYDSNNSSQAARYQELFTYLQKIGEGAVNSPFQTQDSD